MPWSQWMLLSLMKYVLNWNVLLKQRMDLLASPHNQLLSFCWIWFQDRTLCLEFYTDELNMAIDLIELKEFTRNTQMPIGSAIMRTRILQSMLNVLRSKTVVTTIEATKWNALESDDSKMQYLQEILLKWNLVHWISIQQYCEFDIWWWTCFVPCPLLRQDEHSLDYHRGS